MKRLVLAAVLLPLSAHAQVSFQPPQAPGFWAPGQIQTQGPGMETPTRTVPEQQFSDPTRPSQTHQMGYQAPQMGYQGVVVNQFGQPVGVAVGQ